MQLTGLSQLTRDKVNAAFHARWSSGGPPLIFVTTPTPIEGNSVLAAWRGLQTAAAEPVAAPTARDWPYALASQPGKVMPVKGINRVTPPTITKVCTPMMRASPVARSFSIIGTSIRATIYGR